MLNWQKRDPEAPTLRADFIIVWCLSLMHPSTKQGKERLMKKDGSVCCLGDACVTANLLKNLWVGDEGCFSFSIGGESEVVKLPSPLADFLKMSDVGRAVTGQENYYKALKMLGDNSSLAAANDKGKPFYTIAKAISSYPSCFFRDLLPEEEAYIINTARRLLPKNREAYRASIRAFKAASKQDSGKEAST